MSTFKLPCGGKFILPEELDKTDFDRVVSSISHVINYLASQYDPPPPPEPKTEPKEEVKAEEIEVKVDAKDAKKK